MYAWELQNRSVCHIYVVRTPEQRRSPGSARSGWCSTRFTSTTSRCVPQFAAQGIGTALMRHVLDEAQRLGARRATLEVRRSNEAARRLYERLGSTSPARGANYYTNPVEDALILWRDEP